MVVVIMGVLFVITGTAGYVWDVIIGPGDCRETPNNPDCYCPEGYDKIPVASSFWEVFGKWYCEESELMLDPDSPTFEQDSIDYVQAYLSSNCDDDCYNIACEGGEIVANCGQIGTGKRLVNVECNIMTSPDSGYTQWKMMFYVEGLTTVPKTESIFDNYCYNEERTTKCEPPVEIV